MHPAWTLEGYGRGWQLNHHIVGGGAKVIKTHHGFEALLGCRCERRWLRFLFRG